MDFMEEAQLKGALLEALAVAIKELMAGVSVIAVADAGQVWTQTTASHEAGKVPQALLIQIVVQRITVAEAQSSPYRALATAAIERAIASDLREWEQEQLSYPFADIIQ